MSVISDDDLPFDRMDEPDDLADGAADQWRQECERWRGGDAEDMIEEIIRLHAELSSLKDSQLTAEEWDQVRIARIWDDDKRDALHAKVNWLRALSTKGTEEK